LPRSLASDSLPHRCRLTALRSLGPRISRDPPATRPPEHIAIAPGRQRPVWRPTYWPLKKGEKVTDVFTLTNDKSNWELTDADTMKLPVHAIFAK
jgi:hypothetical protein